MIVRQVAMRSVMPAKNIYHDGVVRALLADGWKITHDPLTLSYGGRDLFMDLGAERVALAAEKEGRRIAVEIQSFLGASPVRDLEEAVGQYQVYRTLLMETSPTPCRISLFRAESTWTCYPIGLGN